LANPNILTYIEKGLTYRQARVVYLAALGFTECCIAEIENISQSSVRDRKKLGKTKLN